MKFRDEIKFHLSRENDPCTTYRRDDRFSESRQFRRQDAFARISVDLEESYLPRLHRLRFLGRSRLRRICDVTMAGCDAADTNARARN